MGSYAARTAVSAVLGVHGVSKRYGEREALRPLDFELDAGEMVAVLGPNGAGKTTLLSILAGIQRPSSGSVSRDPREVGWAPQQPALYSKLSVAENLELFARLERVADPRAAVERMLVQTDLTERAHERLERLSGGNRQRVNVALGLIADPPVLVLDEPSAALDPIQRERLWQFVGGLAAAGTSVVFSTHNVGEVQRHARRTLVLADGELLFDGPPAALVRAAGQDAGRGQGAGGGVDVGGGVDEGARRDKAGGQEREDLESAFVHFLAARGH
jgi:ABC-2 type transport system ATP-binding protein